MVGMIVAGMAPHVVNNLVVWGSNAYLTEKDKELGVSMRDLNKWSERMRKPMEGNFNTLFFIKSYEVKIHMIQNF